jgi:rare lipoprotein A
MAHGVLLQKENAHRIKEIAMEIKKKDRRRRTRYWVPLILSALLTLPAHASPPGAPATKHPAAKKAASYAKPHRGKASFYGGKFAGKKMADGTRMDPNANIAASKTLPLGTIAEVVNLQNGKSQVVEIRDRGPYVDGRIIDVSSGVAKKLDMEKQGVAMVEVRPIEIPQSSGR